MGKEIANILFRRSRQELRPRFNKARNGRIDAFLILSLFCSVLVKTVEFCLEFSGFFLDNKNGNICIKKFYFLIKQMGNKIKMLILEYVVNDTVI